MRRSCNQLSNCHPSEPRKSALRTVREKPTFAPCSPRERSLQPVFCTALRAEVGTLYSLPFAVLGVTGFRGVSFLRRIMSAVVVSSLCPGLLFFRSRRFGGFGSAHRFGMSVRHVVSTKQGRQTRIVETVLRQFRFGSEPRGHAPGGDEVRNEE